MQKILVLSLIFFFSFECPGQSQTEVQKSQTKKTLVIVGDSLTEGYGVAREKAYPFDLEKRLVEKHPNWKVINSGIGGSTSASAPGRVKWVLKSNPSIVVLFLGGNDALRGLAPKETKKNLEIAVRSLKSAGVQVLLVEMLAPPNYGKDYTDSFKRIFHEIKVTEKIDLIPFPLATVAGRKDFNQPDGIHPNEKGHAMIADEMLKSLERFL